jgi:hexosaminidase
MDEFYEIRVDEKHATLTANTVVGAIRGLSTWTQLVQQSGGWRVLVNVPFTISDAPRFSHRGLLLDTSRHYFPVDKILRTLDAMETTKLNVFHWHITDSDSFPIVSKTFPRLTEYGAETIHKVYSPEDVKTIVAHAQKRGIRVIPEFDVPGHTASWGFGYPEIVINKVLALIAFVYHHC